MKSLTVGIDLGLDAAKVICLKPTKNSYQLKAHALLKKGQLSALKEFLHHSTLKQAEIRVAMQAPHLKVQQVSIPIVPKDELSQVVSWAFKDASNLPIEDYVIRYYQSGSQDEIKRNLYTAFAVEKSFFEKWREFIENAGVIRAKMAEPDIQSLANIVTYNHGFTDSYRFVIIDIGKTQSQLAVVSKKGIEFFRPFSNIGGDSLAENISRELQIGIEDAETRIIDIANSIPCDKEREIETLISDYCSQFCVQAQYAIEQFTTNAKDSPITNIYLAGGGARLKGLKDQIQDTLHFPTDLVDPFARLDLGQFSEKDFENSKTLYAVATGLAL